jgi:hypothetical protein
MSNDSINPLLLLGMVLLVAGAVALVYGHMELMQAQQDSGFLGGSDGEAMTWQMVRLGGLVVAAVGGVLSFSGAVND